MLRRLRRSGDEDVDTMYALGRRCSIETDPPDLGAARGLVWEGRQRRTRRLHVRARRPALGSDATPEISRRPGTGSSGPPKMATSTRCTTSDTCTRSRSRRRISRRRAPMASARRRHRAHRLHVHARVPVAEFDVVTRRSSAGMRRLSAVHATGSLAGSSRSYPLPYRPRTPTSPWHCGHWSTTETNCVGPKANWPILRHRFSGRRCRAGSVISCRVFTRSIFEHDCDLLDSTGRGW